ncbi:MAG: HEAT repeat domain-containing protein [Myxococcota bacterium]
MHAAAAILALLAIAGSPEPRVDDALDVLEECEALKSRPCLEAAGTLTNAGAEAIAPLMETFDDMTTPGRVLAVSVLVSQDDERATRALVDIARDGSVGASVRTMAIGELSHRFGDARLRRQVRGTLLAAIRDDDPTVRAAAARSLGNRPIKGHAQVLKALVRAAKDSEETVRLEAVLGLGMSGDPKAGPALVDALDDPEPRIRAAAADGLTFVTFPPSIEPLIESLGSQDAAFRRVVGEALVNQTGERYGDDYGLWKEWYRNR